MYGLGILAYELVTAKVPFEARDWFSLANQILNVPVPLDFPRGDKVPTWLVDFIRKATQKDPQLRYQSSEEVLNFLADQFAATDQVGTAPGRRQTVQQSVVLEIGETMATGLYRFAPTLAIMSVVILLMLVLIGTGQRSVDAVQETMSTSSNIVKDATTTAQSLVETIITIQANQDKIKAFDRQLEKLSQQLAEQERLKAAGEARREPAKQDAVAKNVTEKAPVKKKSTEKKPTPSKAPETKPEPSLQEPSGEQ